jgi:GNAT superfamily N-acetyltransferase
MSVLIRPVASLDELARVFDAIGAQMPLRLTSADGRFADLARRFSEDRSLMLIATEGDRVLGGALAFRRDESGVTLRVIAVEPVARGTGLGRRLVKAIEQEASRLGAKLISLGADDAAGFYERLGYVRSGNAFHKRIGPQ